MTLGNLQSELASALGLDMEFYTQAVAGHVIHYGLIGKGDPVVLIHGINVGWGQWYPNIRALAENHTLYLVDLPGAGASSHVDYAFLDIEKDYVETMELFLQDHKLEGAHVIAHSFGCWVALRVALRGRVSIGKMLLLGPLGFSTYVPMRFYPSSFRSVASFLANRLIGSNEKSLDSVLSMMLMPETTLNADFLRYYSQSVSLRGAGSHPLEFISSLCRPFRMRPELDLSEEVIGLQNLIYVIVGSHDPLIDPAAISRALSQVRGCHISIYPHSSHVPSIDDPLQFNEDALRFLSSSS